MNSYALPSTITIKKTSTGTSSEIDFVIYCYVVAASEFAVGTDGTSYVGTEALRAFALCVRNFGWYRTIYPMSTTAYDVTDSSSNCHNFDWNIYNLKAAGIGQTYPRIVQAVTYIWKVMMFDSQKKLFLPPYYAGTYASGYIIRFGESNFSQNGANYWATEKGKTYKEILHYYFDNAKGVMISKGTIILCGTHSLTGSYYSSAKGHSKTCATCGYFSTLSSHSYAVYNGIVKCSVCGYVND